MALSALVIIVFRSQGGGLLMCSVWVQAIDVIILSVCLKHMLRLTHSAFMDWSSRPIANWNKQVRTNSFLRYVFLLIITSTLSEIAIVVATYFIMDGDPVLFFAGETMLTLIIMVVLTMVWTLRIVFKKTDA